MSNPHFNDDYWQRTCRTQISPAPDTDNMRGLLSDLKIMSGITEASIDGSTLSIAYDLREINWLTIKRHILKAGIKFKQSKWQHVRQLLTDYRESILRAEQGIDYGWDVWIQDAYVSRYRLRRHGRRDDRITNWRMYEREDREAAVPGNRTSESKR